MSKASFQVIFDGQALDNHEYDARELGKALYSLSDVFDVADGVLNSGATKNRIKVKASFKTGCFKVDFSSWQEVLTQVQQVLNSGGTTATLNAAGLLGVLFGTTKSVIWLYKKLKGDLPDRHIQKEDGNFEVSYKKEVFLVEKDVFKLYRSRKFRETMKDFTETTFGADGIDDVAFGIGDSVDDLEKNGFINIRQSEKEYFTFIPNAENQYETHESVIDMIWVQVLKPDLTVSQGRWRLDYGGDKKFGAIIEDKKFLKKVENHEILFGYGDLLQIKLRSILKVNKKTRKSETTDYVEHVYQHRTPDKPIQDDLLD